MKPRKLGRGLNITRYYLGTPEYEEEQRKAQIKREQLWLDTHVIPLSKDILETTILTRAWEVIETKQRASEELAFQQEILVRKEAELAEFDKRLANPVTWNHISEKAYNLAIGAGIDPFYPDHTHSSPGENVKFHVRMAIR